MAARRSVALVLTWMLLIQSKLSSVPGFRFIVLDMRLVNGLYLRYPEEKREKRKEQLVEKLKDLLGDIWLVEGPYRVWDLQNQAPSTEFLEYTPSGIGMQRSRLEQKLFELNRLD